MHCYKLVYTHAEDHNLPCKKIIKKASVHVPHCTALAILS